MHPRTNPPSTPQEPTSSPEAELGMVEFSATLSGLAAAIAALLPSTTGQMNGVSPKIAAQLRLFVAILAGVLAAYSSYSALWLLARHCTHRKSLLRVNEIGCFLTQPRMNGPTWLTAISLLIWFTLSLLIAALSMMGQAVR